MVRKKGKIENQASKYLIYEMEEGENIKENVNRMKEIKERLKINTIDKRLKKKQKLVLEIINTMDKPQDRLIKYK